LQFRLVNLCQPEATRTYSLRSSL